jgi:hypothetical protein
MMQNPSPLHVLGLLPALTGFAQAQNPAAPTPPNVDQRVDSIMARMTLEQKIVLLGGVDDFFIRGYAQLG